jgi:RNA chaperone Hfq
MFLSAAAREQQQMTVFLVNGVMLQGAVAAHDQFSLLLERGGQVQLVYKHAISTLQPEHPLSLSGERQATRRTNDNNNLQQPRSARRDAGRARNCRRRRKGGIGDGHGRSAEARLEEAVGLAEAIGIAVVGSRTFRLRAPRPLTLLGKGQVEAVAEIAAEHGGRIARHRCAA